MNVCEDCGREFRSKWLEPEEDEYCENCRENRAERAYEAQMERFYDGSEPVTIDEQHAAAWREKQSLR